MTSLIDTVSIFTIRMNITYKVTVEISAKQQEHFCK